MNQDKIDYFMMSNAKYFPAEKLFDIQTKLLAIDDSQSSLLLAQTYKDPTMVLLLSVLLGAWGVDRFILDDTAMGVLKLLTGGLCGILTMIDWFSASKRAREYNYNTFIRNTMLFKKNDSSSTQAMPIQQDIAELASQAETKYAFSTVEPMTETDTSLTKSNKMESFISNPKFSLIGTLISIALMLFMNIVLTFLPNELNSIANLGWIICNAAYFASVFFSIYSIGLLFMKIMDKLAALILTAISGVFAFIVIYYIQEFMFLFYYLVKSGFDTNFQFISIPQLLNLFINPFTLVYRLERIMSYFNNSIYYTFVESITASINSFIYLIITPYLGIGLPIGILAFQKKKAKI